MDLEGITLREFSQAEKDKYHMISPICGIFKQNKQAHRCRGQTGGYQRLGVRGKRGVKWLNGVKRYKLSVKK